MSVVLRKGKKIIARERTAYDIAAKLESLIPEMPERNVKQARAFLNQNCFMLAIYGAKARLGGGYMVECLPPAGAQ